MKYTSVRLALALNQTYLSDFGRRVTYKISHNTIQLKNTSYLELNHCHAILFLKNKTYMGSLEFNQNGIQQLSQLRIGHE